MSIHGIGGSNIQRPAHAVPGCGTTRGRRRRSRGRSAAVPQPIQQAPANAKSPQGVPVEPPPGTDPALWSVLSGEERAFFAKAGAMGPLTYGRALQEMKSRAAAGRARRPPRREDLT